MSNRVYDHPAFRTCHWGASGIGKNTDFLPRLMRESKTAKWIFIFDHKREFSMKLKKAVVENDAQIAWALSNGPFPRWILFDHHAKYPSRIDGFRFFCQMAYNIAQAPGMKGRKILVADEIQEVAGPNDTPEELITCLDDGRSLQLDAMTIAQSPNGVHTMVRNQFTQHFVFAQSDKNAIEFFLKNGLDEDHIRNLRPGEWLWKNTRSGQTAKGGKAFQPDNKGIPVGGVAI